MKISTILDHIDSGHMALPEFQRGYVWNRDQVRGLFDSLYRRHPVGGLLVWATESKTAAHRGEGQEGSAARVVVLAVTNQEALFRDGGREPATSLEPDTQIATFLLKAGESVEVTQTERYGAAHVVVSASDAPPTALADAERRYLNVRVSVF